MLLFSTLCLFHFLEFHLFTYIHLCLEVHAFVLDFLTLCVFADWLFSFSFFFFLLLLSWLLLIEASKKKIEKSVLANTRLVHLTVVVIKLCKHVYTYIHICTCCFWCVLTSRAKKYPPGELHRKPREKKSRRGTDAEAPTVTVNPALFSTDGTACPEWKRA